MLYLIELMDAYLSLLDSEDADEMPQNMAFHQVLHCLLTQN